MKFSRQVTELFQQALAARDEFLQRKLTRVRLPEMADEFATQQKLLTCFYRTYVSLNTATAPRRLLHVPQPSECRSHELLCRAGEPPHGREPAQQMSDDSVRRNLAMPRGVLMSEPLRPFILACGTSQVITSERTHHGWLILEDA